MKEVPDISECVHILKAVSAKFAAAEGVPVMDSQAFSDACDAAMDLAKSYDPEKGHGFQKYLASLIKRRMVDRMRARAGRKGSFKRQNQILATSLSEVVANDVNGRSVFLADIVEDKRASADAVTAEFMDEVNTILGQMKDQVFANAIRAYFLEGKTMAEAGESVGLSESRVSQIFSQLDQTALWSRLRASATV